MQTPEEKIHQNRAQNLCLILFGEVTIMQHLQFLISNNHSDLLILRQTKEVFIWWNISWSCDILMFYVLRLFHIRVEPDSEKTMISKKSVL